MYFFQAAPGWPVKIGFTRNIRRRLRDLRTASGFHFRVLGVMDGSFALEASLHRRFEAHRIVGEWFRPVVGLVAYIGEHARPWDEGVVPKYAARAVYAPPLETPEDLPMKSGRKVGRGGDSAEKRRLQDEEMDRMDREGIERWRIAAVTGLCERQVYRRLAKIRGQRIAARTPCE